jgi:hypothetical protein
MDELTRWGTLGEFPFQCSNFLLCKMGNHKSEKIKGSIQIEGVLYQEQKVLSPLCVHRFKTNGVSKASKLHYASVTPKERK